MAGIGGRDRLILYERGHLSWFDPELGTMHPLVEVASRFKAPLGGVPHVDITRGLNDDRRDDLTVPDDVGFHVFIQMTDGTFADPVQIGPSAGMDLIDDVDGYRYDPWGRGRVHAMDYHRDGRRDLVFWNEDHFEVHYQKPHGLFEPVAETFTTDVAFDSDDPASLVAPEGVRRRRMDHLRKAGPHQGGALPQAPGVERPGPAFMRGNPRFLMEEPGVSGDSLRYGSIRATPAQAPSIPVPHAGPGGQRILLRPPGGHRRRG